ncbi:MAG TPA: hypothetical protein VK123_08645 [Candidatus Limnocylindrales bacterium]|nr:hypothetical protein [Candidatus Limnocylindrales bacterium]
MSGVIAGGWEYVIAAYAATAVVLGGYAASVFLRWRTERNRAATESGGGRTT